MIATDSITIRTAAPEDASTLLDIYAPYVKHTAVTFEYEVPSVEEFSERIRRILSRYPYLIAVMNHQIVGYAYAAAFHERPAAGWAVETSIYLNQSCRGYGIGKRLYLLLEDILKAQHILNMNACIAYPNPESIAFHEALGYKTIGHFHHCGFKSGNWYDLIWMEKIIGEHEVPPKPVIPFEEVKGNFF